MQGVNIAIYMIRCIPSAFKQVLPSQRQGQKTSLYRVWVCLHKTQGWILTGHCTCMAGLSSSCSHVAALLFKLEAAVHFQLNTPTACTSQLCSWKASRKSVQPATIKSIDFSRAKKHSLPKVSGSFLQVNETKHYSCSDPTKTRNPISNEKLKDLYRIYPQAAIFTSLDVTSFQSVNEGTASVTCDIGSDTDSDTENENNIIPEPLVSLFDPTAINMDESELKVKSKILYQQYVASNYQNSFDNLEVITRKQSLSSAWRVHRAGRITASICKQVSKMQKSDSLIKTIMQYSPSLSSKFTAHGIEMEPIAKDCFITIMSKSHRNLQVLESGLKINADEPFLGASPDGIVTCDCHEDAVLEIKCPYKYKDGLSNWELDKDFPIYSNFAMKKDHSYYYQIQLQMELSNVHFGYFFVFSPAEKASLLCIVEKDANFVSNLKQVLSMKFYDCILPEVVSRKMDSDVSHDRRLYCICKRPEFGNMIYCDNPSCKIVKFHYSCVNVTRKPRGQWVCNSCRTKNTVC